MQNNNGAIPPIDEAPVSRKAGKSSAGKLLFLVGGAVLAVTLIAGSVYFMFQSSGNKKLEKQQSALISETHPNVTIDSKSIASQKEQIRKDMLMKEQQQKRAKLEAMREAQAEQARQVMAARSKAATAAYEAQTSPQHEAESQSTDNKKRPLTPDERKMTDDVFFKVGGNGGASSIASTVSSASKNTGSLLAPKSGNSGSVFGQSATVFAARSAGRLSDRDYLLTTGTSIPCALVTKINTTLKGLVICRVTNDVYSSNGHTLLIGRGATVTGQQTRSVKNGEARIFVLWTRIDTDGVTVNIDSPAAGQLGASGVNAFVDNHFWERFGTAIMVSLIDDGTQYAIAKESNNNGGTSFSNTTKTGDDLAKEILKQQGNIPPTGITNNAKLVNILVSRDVTFKSVYRLLK